MSTATEKHFSVAEIAALWGVSTDTVRRIFADLPGVLKIGKQSNSKNSRKYITLRIPEKLVTQQHAKLTAVTR